MRAYALITLALLLFVGCGKDFDSRMMLDGYRVVGITAEPPEVGPDDTLTLTVHDHDAAEAEYRWSVCLLTFGSGADFECVDPRLAFAVDERGPVFQLDLSADGPITGGLRALYAMVGPFPTMSGQPLTLETGFDIYVMLESGPADGRTIHSVKRVRIREGHPTPNQNPRVRAFVVNNEDGGTTAKVGSAITLKVELAEGTEEPYTTSQGEARTEAFIYTWFSTIGGETSPAITYGDARETTLTVANTPGEAMGVYVAIRDGRGGLTVRSARIDIVE